MTEEGRAICIRLTTLRQQRGMTAMHLARELGVHRRCIYSWERGERTPLLSNAIKWARALGAEIEMTGA